MVQIARPQTWSRQVFGSVRGDQRDEQREVRRQNSQASQEEEDQARDQNLEELGRRSEYHHAFGHCQGSCFAHARHCGFISL